MLKEWNKTITNVTAN